MEVYDLTGASMRDRLTVLKGCVNVMRLYEESLTSDQRRRLLEMADEQISALSTQLLPSYAAEIEAEEPITWPVEVGTAT